MYFDAKVFFTWRSFKVIREHYSSLPRVRRLDTDTNVNVAS